MKSPSVTRKSEIYQFEILPAQDEIKGKQKEQKWKKENDEIRIDE